MPIAPNSETTVPEKALKRPTANTTRTGAAALPFVPSQLLLGKLAAKSNIQRLLVQIAAEGGDGANSGAPGSTRALSFGENVYPHLFFAEKAARREKETEAGTSVVSPAIRRDECDRCVASGVPRSIIGMDAIETVEQVKLQQRTRREMMKQKREDTYMRSVEANKRRGKDVREDILKRWMDEEAAENEASIQQMETEGEYLLACLREPAPTTSAADAALQLTAAASSSVVAQGSSVSSSGTGSTAVASHANATSNGVVAVSVAPTSFNAKVGFELTSAILDLLESTASNDAELTYLGRVRWVERQRQLNTLTSTSTGSSWRNMSESERVKRTMEMIDSKRKRFRRERHREEPQE